MNQLRIPPWLRSRTPAERERERRHLAALEWLEKLAKAAGWNIRPRVKDEKAKDGK